MTDDIPTQPADRTGETVRAPDSPLMALGRIDVDLSRLTTGLPLGRKPGDVADDLNALRAALTPSPQGDAREVVAPAPSASLRTDVAKLVDPPAFEADVNRTGLHPGWVGEILGRRVDAHQAADKIIPLVLALPAEPAAPAGWRDEEIEVLRSEIQERIDWHDHQSAMADASEYGECCGHHDGRAALLKRLKEALPAAPPPPDEAARGEEG